MIPETYPSPRELPFNQASLAATFVFRVHHDDPGGDGVWVLLRGNELAVQVVADEMVLPSGELPGEVDGSECLFIGNWAGRPCRAVSLEREVELPAAYQFHALTSPVPQLSIALLSLGGLARQVLHWHDNSRYCGRCGSAQQWLPGEWGKLCRQCGQHHFPHIHPCVIVVVRRPGKILMTRKAEWPEGRYSLVAGFLDMGECLEEAVVREVREETGIEITNVRYIGSQSWPFPSQLMAGFVADYAGGEIRIEEKELEDVRWFPVDDLPKLPPKRSISRYLIDHYKNKE